MTPKIATCCYCGTRAVLALTGRERHELSCSACGAPLHDMKMLRADHGGLPGRVPPSRVRGTIRDETRRKPYKPWKKKRKSPMARLFEEVVDLIEDIID